MALRARLAELEGKRETIEAQLAALDVDLHVEADLKGGAAVLVRSLIESMVVRPGETPADTTVEIRSYIESLVGTMQKSPAGRITPAGLYDNGGRTGGI